MDRSCDSATKSGRGMPLLGHIPERGLNEEFDVGGCGHADERFVPTRGQRFSAGENNGVHSGRAAQMRRGEFDHATHTAGAQMIMNNDEFQSLVIS